VTGNATMLRHALDALLDNALRHGGGTISIDLILTDESVTLRLSDDGPGFTSPPFETEGSRVDQTGGAVHGLGLPLARRLVEAMPGRLVIVRSGPKPQLDIVLRRAWQNHSSGDVLSIS
jgi:signal transduction histidine kinase